MPKIRSILQIRQIQKWLLAVGDWLLAQTKCQSCHQCPERFLWRRQWRQWHLMPMNAVDVVVAVEKIGFMLQSVRGSSPYLSKQRALKRAGKHPQHSLYGYKKHKKRHKQHMHRII